MDTLSNYRVDLADMQVFHWKKLHLKLQYVFCKEVFEETQHLAVIFVMFQHFLAFADRLFSL